MNVYDKAHDLAKALASSEEYRTYKAARDKVNLNEQHKSMMKDFKRKQFKLQADYLSGKQPSNEEMESLRKLSEILSFSPDLNEYMAAEFRFNQMMSDVYKILGDAVEVDLDFMEEDEDKTQE